MKRLLLQIALQVLQERTGTAASELIFQWTTANPHRRSSCENRREPSAAFGMMVNPCRIENRATSCMDRSMFCCPCVGMVLFVHSFGSARAPSRRILDCSWIVGTRDRESEKSEACQVEVPSSSTIDVSCYSTTLRTGTALRATAYTTPTTRRDTYGKTKHILDDIHPIESRTC